MTSIPGRSDTLGRLKLVASSPDLVHAPYQEGGQLHKGPREGSTTFSFTCPFNHVFIQQRPCTHCARRCIQNWEDSVTMESFCSFGKRGQSHFLLLSHAFLLPPVSISLHSGEFNLKMIFFSLGSWLKFQEWIKLLKDSISREENLLQCKILRNRNIWG